MASKATKIKTDKSLMFFKIFSYVSITIFSFLCLFPFLLIISGSLTAEQEIILNGYALIPKDFSLDAYTTLFKVPEKVLRAYYVTIVITVIGTSVGLLMMSMAAYVLNRKDFKYRNGFSFFLYFTTLFSGGIVPFYILMVNVFHLTDTFASMIIPSVCSVWSILLMRNFMKSIPDSLSESATIDGAGDFKIYRSIIMPLSLPSLATIGLFQALAFWNEWYNASLYIQDQAMYPLQLFLKNMLSSVKITELVTQGLSITDTSTIPTEGMKMAMAVVAIGPIILLYPFVQKYFVAGLTVGAVKG